MKYDIPNIPKYLHISDPNLLYYKFHHIVFNLMTQFPWSFESTASGGVFFAGHKKCIFLNMSAKLVLKS